MLNEMFKLSKGKDLKEASLQVTRVLEQEMKVTSDFAKNEAPKFRFKCSVCD